MIPDYAFRYSFEQAVEAFETTKLGKSPDGKPVIKCMISGHDVPAEPL